MNHDHHHTSDVPTGSNTAKSDSQPSSPTHASHALDSPHEHSVVAIPTAEVMFTCPMHPQIRKPTPGNCPICGMSLEPVMPTLEEGSTRNS